MSTNKFTGARAGFGWKKKKKPYLGYQSKITMIDPEEYEDKPNHEKPKYIVKPRYVRR